MSHFHKVVVIWFGLILVGVIAIVLIPRKYQSRATLLPVEQKTGPLIGSFGSSLAASFLGAGAPSSSSSVIQSILKSDTLKRDVVLDEEVFDNLAKDPDLKSARETGGPDWERRHLPILVSRLEGMVTVVASTEGPIVIDVISRSPDMSSDIVQAYVDSLSKILKERTSSQAKRKRQFTERLVEERRAELETLRKKLLNFDADGNIQNLSPELIPVIEEVSELERKRSSLRMQRDFLNKYSDSSEGSNLNEALDRELAKLEVNIKNTVEKGKRKSGGLSQAGVIRPSGRIPLVALEYQLALAEVNVLSEVVATLQRELEMLKIEEVSDEISFQVLDKPLPSDSPIYPRRTQMAVLWAFFLTLLAILYLFKRNRIRQMLLDLKGRAGESLRAE